jgi:D-amino-acid dehydrogenase
VVVVGGGLVGRSTAYELACRGREVLLIDRADLGRATDAGAGILSPYTSELFKGAVLDFALAAFEHFPSLLAELGSAPENDAGFGATDCLVVAMADDDLERFARLRKQFVGAHPEAVEVIAPAEAIRLLPALGDVAAALLSRRAARVDGRRLNAAMAVSGRRAGVVELNGSVDSVEEDADGATVHLSGGGSLAAGAVVVAAGAWTPALLASYREVVPVHPQRGQLVHLRSASAAGAGWPIVEGLRSHYILPWPDGRVTCGATRESGSGFAPVLTAGGMKEVLREALRVSPGLIDDEVAEWRVGLRPVSESGLPLVGRLPGSARLFVATGHGANGLLLGPYTGLRLAEEIVGGRPVAELAVFNPGRPTPL